jgi:hypothetical protein
MERRTLWPLALPLTGASTLLAHEGAYGFAGTPEDHLHGYLGHAPLFFGAFACGVVLALALRLRGRIAGTPPAWPYGALPLVVYVAQEALERVVTGAAPLADGRALLLGLALQLPLGIAAYLLARALLTSADTLVDLVRGRLTVVPGVPVLVAAPVKTVGWRSALRSRGRAPPAR